MIEIPLKYRNEVINRYGNRGASWLDQIDDLVKKYQEKFKLTNIKLVDNLSINIVFKAHSAIFGDVFVKFSTPGSNAINEVNFINNCNSKYIVKCYYYDLTDRVMILESITPGTTLKEIKKRSERISIFAEIMNDLLMDDKDNKYGEYRLKESFNNLELYQDLDLNMELKIATAKKLYGEIEKANLKKYVLHRDLQHKNILKSENYFKVIDPHGLLGYKVFELTPFITIELTLENYNLNKLHEIVAEVSVAVNEDINLIYKALYVDTVNKIIFYMQSIADKEIVDFNNQLCSAIIMELEK